MKRETFPAYEQLEEWVDRFVESHRGLAEIEALGESDGGRPVRAVRVTDPSVNSRTKQAALVVCGRHGNELGTRAVGPAVLEWLVSNEAAGTRARQVVTVVPAANPDGAARDEFGLPADGLSAFEERTIVALACRTRADAVIDFHSMGEGDLQAVITAHTTGAGEDEFIHREIAARMVRSAAAEGFAHLLHSVRTGGYNNWFCGACYERVKPLVFGVEVNHFVLGPRQAGASGLGVTRALLDEGNGRSPWEETPGYPNGIVCGDFRDSIRCMGDDPAARGASREELWSRRAELSWPRRKMPDPRTVRTVFTGAPARCRLVSRLTGTRSPRKVMLNGEPCEPRTWTDECSTYVAALAPPGDSELVIEM